MKKHLLSKLCILIFSTTLVQQIQPSEKKEDPLPYINWVKKCMGKVKDGEFVATVLKKEQEPNHLSNRGIFYIMQAFPVEIQREIIQYLVQNLDPLIVGFKEEELINFDNPDIHFEKSQVKISSFDENGKMECDCDCTIQKKIPEYDPKFSIKSSTNYPPHLKNINKILKPSFLFSRESKTGNRLFIYSKLNKNNLVYYKRLPKKTINHTLFENPKSCFLNLFETLILIDQNNALKKNSSLELTKKTLGAVVNLEKKICNRTLGAVAFPDKKYIEKNKWKEVSYKKKKKKSPNIETSDTKIKKNNEITEKHNNHRGTSSSKYRNNNS